MKTHPFYCQRPEEEVIETNRYVTLDELLAEAKRMSEKGYVNIGVSDSSSFLEISEEQGVRYVRLFDSRTKSEEQREAGDFSHVESIARKFFERGQDDIIVEDNRPVYFTTSILISIIIGLVLMILAILLMTFAWFPGGQFAIVIGLAFIIIPLTIVRIRQRWDAVRS
ncbi:MAG: hypothetical protein MI892_20450 [Desulfobacterales bacterium]|nr:hypothetical protein [Desulfobacterales bacterium]